MKPRKYQKLTEDQIKYIAKEYSNREKTTEELAQEMGVSRQQIYYVVLHLRQAGMTINKKARDYKRIASELSAATPVVEQ